MNEYNLPTYFIHLKPIHVHEMPNISFASGGDTDTLDFVAYVAKDRAGVRSCFVLECGGGIAQDVITTVGQAFELRYDISKYWRVTSINSIAITQKRSLMHTL